MTAATSIPPFPDVASIATGRTPLFKSRKTHHPASNRDAKPTHRPLPAHTSRPTTLQNQAKIPLDSKATSKLSIQNA